MQLKCKFRQREAGNIVSFCVFESGFFSVHFLDCRDCHRSKTRFSDEALMFFTESSERERNACALHVPVTSCSSSLVKRAPSLLASFSFSRRTRMPIQSTKRIERSYSKEVSAYNLQSLYPRCVVVSPACLLDSFCVLLCILLYVYLTYYYCTQDHRKDASNSLQLHVVKVNDKEKDL